VEKLKMKINNKTLLYTLAGFGILAYVLTKTEQTQKNITESAKIVLDKAKSNMLFQYITQVANTYKVDKYLALATCWQESTFNSQAIGDGGKSYGSFQVQQSALDDFNLIYNGHYSLGDLLNPFFGVEVGIGYLKIVSERYAKSYDYRAIAERYNNGSNKYNYASEIIGKIEVLKTLV